MKALLISMKFTSTKLCQCEYFHSNPFCKCAIKTEMGTFMRTHGWKYGKHSIIKIFCPSEDYKE